jgi:hypothetical protein
MPAHAGKTPNSTINMQLAAAVVDVDNGKH